MCSVLSGTLVLFLRSWLIPTAAHGISRSHYLTSERRRTRCSRPRGTASRGRAADRRRPNLNNASHDRELTSALIPAGEALATGVDPRAAGRRELASLLLQRAASPEPPRAEAPRRGRRSVSARLRDRRETQAAYARDLALWFVWLDGHGYVPFEVTRVVDTFVAQPLPGGAAPGPSTTARRLAALSG